MKKSSSVVVVAYAAHIACASAFAASAYKTADHYVCRNGFCPAGVYTLSLNKSCEFAFACALAQLAVSFVAVSVQVSTKHLLKWFVVACVVLSALTGAMAAGAVLSNGFLRNATKAHTLLVLAVFNVSLSFCLSWLTSTT